MAIIHRAQLRPSKSELIARLLATRSWGESGEIDMLGAYRFDDPDGEVGVECHLVAVGDTLFHLPLTYRSGPLDGGDDALIGTLQHSVLGERYVYDGLGDEVALDCFRRALCGQQEQAVLEVHDGGEVVEHRAQSVLLRREVDAGGEPPSADDLLDDDLLDGEPFTIARTLDGLDGTVRLVVEWDGGTAVVAAYGGGE